MAQNKAATLQGALEAIAAPSRRPIIVSFGVFAKRQPAATLAAIFLIAILAIAIAAPLTATHDPLATDTPHKLESPSLDHFAGTDDLGRDLWSRLVWGGQTSLIVGYSVTFVSTILGAAIAVISGYFGRTVDLVIQRIVDAWQSIPQLLFVLTIVTVLTPSVLNLIIILSIIFSFRGVRLKRSGVLRVKGLAYIDSARAIGASDARIIIHHVLPNIMYLLVISASLTVGQVITTEATLGFLGFGIPPPDPTWGQMLSGSARRFMTQAPWMALAPGIAITLTVLAFNVLGDALRDIMDPRLRGSERR